MPAIHHIALGSADVARLAAFYRDVVGLPERMRRSDPAGRLVSVWLDADGLVLMVEASDARRNRPSGVDAGWFLVAFACEASARNSRADHLVSKGVICEGQTDYSVYFRDPDGNRFALTSYPDPAPHWTPAPRR